ncbi:MAG: uracil-DNA glycosylase family protein [Polyangiales bacterium]|nr:uracil-DNA glycosylase family protein [Myxococcales bacterium]MCB9657146.1 uracil-DNA glycosylase family protein [Sandaracinaceae bacterium]
MSRALKQLLSEVRACEVCKEHLPLGPRPVLRASATARLLVIGQAPGTKVHESGIPWDDASGDHLREWLAMPKQTFYDERRVAIVPMGFCYPGRASQGDLPPRPECAPLWHARLRGHMPRLGLTLLVGQYAQAHYLGKRRKGTLTDTVASYREYLPELLPTPHPSWRSRMWIKKNPWFEEELLPDLRARVAALLS